MTDGAECSEKSNEVNQKIIKEDIIEEKFSASDNDLSQESENSYNLINKEIHREKICENITTIQDFFSFDRNNYNDNRFNNVNYETALFDSKLSIIEKVDHLLQKNYKIKNEAQS